METKEPTNGTATRTDKFKFSTHQLSVDFLIDEMNDWKDDFTKTDCPLPYNNLPDGEYMIRGNKKATRKKYWKLKGEWFLIEDVKKDNGHYSCDSTEYNLFPSLPKKEWDKIIAAGRKRLNPLWQRHLYGYLHWCELRELTRGVKKSFLKYDKEINNGN